MCAEKACTSTQGLGDLYSSLPHSSAPLNKVDAVPIPVAGMANGSQATLQHEPSRAANLPDAGPGSISGCTYAEATSNDSV
jgi:hypothetical protein